MTLNTVYYSPTGTTQKIVKEIGQNLDSELIFEYNLTRMPAGLKNVIGDDSLTIIGVPVYGGRLPISAVESLKNLTSNGSPVVLVVVYGNRAFEDSLLELNEIAIDCGFNVIAATAFIGEHSYSTVDKPIAEGRPDEQDLIKCSDFSSLIKNKLDILNSTEKVSEVIIPGQYPYKERNQPPVSIHPETDNQKCNKCGICVDVCPTHAITINESVNTNGELCTWCCACVKSCPNEARIFDNPAVNAIKDRLFTNCSARKEPEFFV